MTGNVSNAVTRVEQACADLREDGQPITYTAVASRSGLGRTTLYRNPTLRAVVEEHRHHSNGARTLTGLAADIAALRTALEEIAARVRRHEEQLRRHERRTTT